MRQEKVSNQESWRFVADKQYRVAVWLRAALAFRRSPTVRAIPRAMDGALLATTSSPHASSSTFKTDVRCPRAQQQGGCDEPLWYELPYHLTSGRPVPIGLAFGLSLTPAQIAAFAQHPFVEKIEPWPGTALRRMSRQRRRRATVLRKWKR